jgi:hypothetical protein
LSYRPGDDRISGISLELGQQNLVNTWKKSTELTSKQKSHFSPTNP